ncbi:MAG: hypothetical protein KBT36_13145 [Kurthia sp.]|nr:hypothetical protein [Candidatus Kurthia equi]
MKKTNKQGFILPLLVACIIIGAIYATYMYVIAPKLDQQNSLEANNIALSEEAEALQQQLMLEKDNTTATAKTDAELHMKVPEQRSIAQLIKQIEKFEGISDVLVSNVAFNNYDVEVGQQFSEQASAEENQQVTGDTEEAQPAEENNANTDNQNVATENLADAEKEEASAETKATPITSLDYANLPNNIKLVTVSMTVSANEESEVLDFLKQVEKSVRLIRVDSIDYTEENPEQTEQVTAEEQTTDNYPANAVVQLTTFYEQGLTTSE